ncbi:HAMP domain-containing histidine kinase [Ignatzschineria cameli]|uniref:histidine kinase n=1 Tax=Ignatzschineria cameli TaxID=2182793 RepID=A0A2U2AKH2_9GAMM|nr:HAMP domain-containing histidine kinase [Ignatzschineria cameli]PWD85717.1 HAMP domain-containing histidine kinase [Ignatzschineria cameli]PWD88376.1 HAMP domain-containing histidine kinase [Ignatzschineria cameli]PWD88836.1 HAMP domain-containing histidine kinase [Ignatzschineria cameli]PWD89342.1 HAMP domain-containing histidine kinase [Ignatzschineria cameli]
MLLVIILGVMVRSIESAVLYSRYYTWIIIAGAICFLSLMSLVIYFLIQLLQGVRKRRLGARLNARMMIFFSGLSVVPIVILFLFAGIMIQRGIDSWFDESLDQGFDDALTLAQSALETRRLDALEITQSIGQRVADLTSLDLAYELENLRFDANALDLTVFDHRGRILATSSSNTTVNLPELPNDIVLMSVFNDMDYVWLEPVGDDELQVRVIIRVDSDIPRVVQAIYEIPQRYTELGLSTQASVESYKQYKTLQESLKGQLIAILTLVSLLAILLALGGSYFATRRLVNPIRRLSLASKAVSEGNFDREIVVKSNDEIGFLTESFNEMIMKLRQANEAEKASQRLLVAQRSYLEAVLANLSSGVLVLDNDGNIRTFNEAALSILKTDRRLLQKLTLSHLESIDESLHFFFIPLQNYLEKRERGENDRLEVMRVEKGITQILSVRVSEPLENRSLPSGYAIVFDDITQLINSEREAAWGEVARRLAHEIKNPLTPIQLSAERLAFKLQGKLEVDDRFLLEKSTQTIITQVNAMKKMVNAFSQYARAPKLHLKKIDLNALTEEVTFLYSDYVRGVEVILQKPAQSLYVNGDEIRLRQLLHNLIKNAIEACQEEKDQLLGKVYVEISKLDETHLSLTVSDNGSGIDESLINRMFEPYVSTKEKGTGLGLSVVKKIVEEHNGKIAIYSGKEQIGTRVEVMLPLYEELEEGKDNVE